MKERCPIPHPARSNPELASPHSSGAPSRGDRSGEDPEPLSHPPLIQSLFIPLPGDFLILELRAGGEKNLLKIEKGAKNEREIEISLYINNRLLERIQLLHSHVWELSSLVPGLYTLQLQNKIIFRFKIQG